MKSLAIANHCGFLLGFIPSCFVGKLIAKIMTSRSTHNSQAAEFHAMNSAAVIKTLAVNSSLPSTGSSEPPATSQSLTLDQLSPAFLASIVTAVKQALAAEQLQASNLPATPAASFVTSLPKAGALGGVPGSSLSSGQLDAQASVLAASGVGFRLSLRLLPLPRPNIALILLYLHLSLHLLL